MQVWELQGTEKLINLYAALAAAASRAGCSTIQEFLQLRGIHDEHSIGDADLYEEIRVAAAEELCDVRWEYLCKKPHSGMCLRGYLDVCVYVCICVCV